MNTLKALVFACAALLSACTSLGQLDATSAAPSNDESVFVLGVSPENYRVTVFPGSINNGRFSESIFRTAVVYGTPKEGFVVGKARAGDVVAITKVTVVADSSSIIGSIFVACGDAKTMVFQIPKGKVVYLGSAEYVFQGKELRVAYRNDIEGARRHLERNFPLLKGEIESVEGKMLPTYLPCTSTFYVPIYL